MKHHDRVPAGCPLTNRQYEVMSRLAGGATYKEIARALEFSASAVRNHAHHAYKRLGVAGRGKAAAVVVMKDSGWLGALPRRPQHRDDSQDVTVVQAAYCYAFVRLCRERTLRAAAIVTIAFGLLAADHGMRIGPRRAPDIDELLLRMARGLLRPIPVADPELLLAA